MKANAEHFFKAFEHCVNNKFTHQQAMVMCRGFSKRGFIDASEGCAHYVMIILARIGTEVEPKKQEEPTNAICPQTPSI